MDLTSIASDAAKCQTEEACEDFLMNLRWANGFHCPRCDHHEAFRIRSRRLLECKECRMQVSITAGTIIHNSKLPLLTWFRAIHKLFEHGSEVTAYGLSELLHINYRSAKLMIQKICFAFKVEQSRLLAFHKLKQTYAESRRQKEEPAIAIAGNNKEHGTNLDSEFKDTVANRTVYGMSSRECRTFVTAHYSEKNAYLPRTNSMRFTLKHFVSIHLYTRFLKCYAV